MQPPVAISQLSGFDPASSHIRRANFAEETIGMLFAGPASASRAQLSGREHKPS